VLGWDWFDVSTIIGGFHGTPGDGGGDWMTGTSGAISVTRLCKEYCYHEQRPGLAGAWSSLVSRRRQAKLALDEVSFQVETGVMTGLLGPNGAGKTTALKILCGVLRPTSGQATVLGYVPWERRLEMRRQISVMFGHRSQLWWDLPASASFELWRSVYEVEPDRCRRIIADVGAVLGVERLLDVPVRKLSLGERMKMEFIAAVLHSPRALFLDEPTLGLDLVSQKAIHQFLHHYQGQHKAAIIVTSHNISDIRELCRRAIIINNGTIVHDGLLSEVAAKFTSAKRVKAAFSQEVPPTHLRFRGIECTCSGFGVELEVPAELATDVGRYLLQELPVSDLTIEEPLLEEVLHRAFTQAQEGVYKDDPVNSASS